MFIEIVMIIVVPTLLVVVATVVLGRRRAKSDDDSDSDSQSFAGGVLSALFTVVLAFYIVFAWQQGADVESGAGAETDALLAVYWQADALPVGERGTLQGLAREYATTVADSEWALLAEGESDPRIVEIIRELRSGFAALPADGGVLESVRDQGLRDVRQVDEAHRSRVDASTDTDAFNDVLLGGSILGAALMIMFPLLVGLSASRVNVAVMATLTLTLGFTVFLAVQLAHPLDGPFGIEPQAFLDALAEMRPSARTIS